MLKMIILGFGIIIVSAVVTVVAIKSFYKTPVAKVSDSPASAVKTISPTDLIKKYTDSYKLDGYTISTSTGNSVLKYKLSDTSYTVQINALDNVQFAKTDGSTSDDLKLAVDNAKTYLTSSHLKKASEQIVTNSTEMTYDNQNTVCKIFSNLDPINKASTYGLVCTDKKMLVAERDSIQTLIDLYKKASGTVDFKDVVQTTHSESNKSISLLSINPQNVTKAPYTLIFASIDSKWSYVGERVTPSVDVKDSFQLSNTLKTAVNNPKYNGFLAKYIY